MELDGWSIPGKTSTSIDQLDEPKLLLAQMVWTVDTASTFGIPERIPVDGLRISPWGNGGCTSKVATAPPVNIGAGWVLRKPRR